MPITSRSCGVGIAPTSVRSVGIAERYPKCQQKIEAEVRKQKLSTGIPITSVMESTTDTTTVAASTAAATAASVIQTAISQIDAEAKAPAAE